MTELVPRANGELAEINAEDFIVPGMENVQPGELRIPILKLVQGTSRMNGAAEHQGEWHNSVTNTFEPARELLIIGTADGRALWADEFDAGNKPLCKSNDGIAPLPEHIGSVHKMIGKDAMGGPLVSAVTIPAKCEDCPLSQWAGDEIPPRCSAVETFAGLDETGLPALFQLSRTGLKNVRALKTMLVANGIRRAIRLASVRETNEKGTYGVPTFTIGDKPGKDWQKTALRVVRQAGNIAKRNQIAAMEHPEPVGYNGGGAGNPGAPIPEYEDNLPF